MTDDATTDQTQEQRSMIFDPMHAQKINSEFKKGKKPIVGDAFGNWAGNEQHLVNLPGGSALTFDLSRLQLSDFRQMRWHPQVNISLSVLNFMFHQIEWRVVATNPNEPKAKKIASEAEVNLRTIWSQMVGCINQAFWAGFSPSVIEWKNNVITGRVDINRFKDLVPEECTVNWKEVLGWAPPGRTRPKFRTYDGITQVGGSGWPIPAENTFWYSLLMENGDYYGRKLLKPAFTPWYFSTLVHLFANRYYERFGEPTPIGRAPYDVDVETPDGVVTGREAMEQVMMNLRNRGVVTLPSDRDPTTKEFDYTLEYMESQMRGVDFDRYLSRLDEEISLGMFTPMLLFRSGDVGSNSLGVQHTQCVSGETKIRCIDGSEVKAKDIKPGTKIVAFDAVQRATTKGRRDRRWREATIEVNRPATKHCMEVFTDNGPSVVASVDHPWFVRRYGRFDWMDTADLLEGDEIVRCPDGMPEIGSVLDVEDCEVARVTSVVDVGDHEVASIRTSHKTFVTGGYLSHNTFLWMLNGIYGDIKYYIDQFILDRWKVVNYGERAPSIEWAFHKMGRESQETVRAIMTALLAANKVSVDLDELGQSLGMSLKEVRATKDDPSADPAADPTAGQVKPGSDTRQRDDKKPSAKSADGGEPRATGRKVSARVASQVRSAWKKATFDSEFVPSLGHEHLMIESLVASGYSYDEAKSRSGEFYNYMNRAISDIAGLGMESFSGPADVMSIVDRHIDQAIDKAIGN